MKDAAQQLAVELETVRLEMPNVPVVHNQNAAIAESVDEIRERLQMQLYQPVKWVASVQFMQRRGISTLIECGPGKVLTGLTRRIERSLLAYAIFDADSLETALDSTQFSNEE
jgi:[acyl-carrier-protein] S-malonyltransferase